ncbi:MAG TPA: hypothetical protein VGX76_01055 [Pirellulales bacterium]|jgi:nitroreductase|nr:hypothetical protein [Pirellulales bacterium]
MIGRLQSLVSAASGAPSGDNTQPWRFVIDAEAPSVTIELDATRDTSPMNAGQRMARIALGAALENLVRASSCLGLEADVDLCGDGSSAVVRLNVGVTTVRPIEAAIFARTTNRRFYDSRPLAQPLLTDLCRQTPRQGAVETRWITDRGKMTQLAAVIGRADAVMFGVASMRAAFLANVRFDAPAAGVASGLPLATLELSRADRWALGAMRRAPSWLFKLPGALRSLGRHASRLVRSASGMCLIVAHGNDPLVDWSVGRCAQRAWLALTSAGLAAQPMMSLAVLENAVRSTCPATRHSLDDRRVRALLSDFAEQAPELGQGRPAFLLRFGYAPAASARTGRRPEGETTAVVEHGLVAEMTG